MSETATFAAGCFWGIEDAFMNTTGVLNTRVGYIGGHLDSPTYRAVCGGDTDHAEAVEVVFDPEKVSYEELLTLFWAIHDPTTLNRQGPDVGTQYRSAIFYHSPEQQQLAQKSLEALDATTRFSRPIVTQIVPTSTFWEAEDYHQKYNQKHGRHCSPF